MLLTSLRGRYSLPRFRWFLWSFRHYFLPAAGSPGRMKVKGRYGTPGDKNNLPTSKERSKSKQLMEVVLPRLARPFYEHLERFQTGMLNEALFTARFESLLQKQHQ